MDSLAVPGSPIDINLLDSAVLTSIRDPGANDVRQVLDIFSMRPDAWTAASGVLGSNCSNETKFVMLSILRNSVTSNWPSFDIETRGQIIGLILPETIRLVEGEAPRNCVIKANEVIVEILKFEWPQNYPSFVDDLIQAMRGSPRVCANGMTILEQLAEDINNYIECGITAIRSIEMGDAFENQFPQIFNSVLSVLGNNESMEVDLIHATLKALKDFVPLVDVKFFIATDLFHILTNVYIQNPEFAIEVVDVFGEIGNVPVMPKEFNLLIPVVFKSILQGLSTVITDDSSFATMSLEFIEIFSSTLKTYLSRFPAAIEALDNGNWAKLAISWMANLTNVAQNDSFVTCIEYWHFATRRIRRLIIENNSGKLKINQGQQSSGLPFPELLAIYEPSFLYITELFISRFVQPYEVVERQDVDGTTYNEVIETNSPIYEPLKSALIYLTDMNSNNAFQVLLKQSSINDIDSHRKFIWAAACLNSQLCDDFINTVFEIITSASEAVPKSYLWYVSQQQRFLSCHPQILQNASERVLYFLLNCNDSDNIKEFCIFAINNLFNYHPLCLTFANNSLFVPFFNVLNNSLNVEYYIEYLIGPLGLAVSAIENSDTQKQAVNVLLSKVEEKWTHFFGMSENENVINHPLAVIHTMRAFGKAASSLGSLFAPYAMKFFPSFVKCHEIYSSLNMPFESEDAYITILNVKTSIVCAIESFALKMPKCLPSTPYVPQFVIEHCLEMVKSFGISNMKTRDSELLRLFGILCEHFGSILIGYSGELLSSLFQPTVDSIMSDYTSFESHRIALCYFIRGFVRGCFSFIVEKFGSNSLCSFINTIRFLTSHYQTNICTIALTVMIDFVECVRKSPSLQFTEMFSGSFGSILIAEVIRLMTDSHHYFAFNEECDLLIELLQLPHVSENIGFITTNLHDALFSYLTKSQIEELLVSLINSINNKLEFRQNLRDFMISTKRIRKSDIEIMKRQIRADDSKVEEFFLNEMQKFNVS